jgi:hypothetical protein
MAERLNQLDLSEAADLKIATTLKAVLGVVRRLPAKQACRRGEPRRGRSSDVRSDAYADDERSRVQRGSHHLPGTFRPSNRADLQRSAS